MGVLLGLTFGLLIGAVLAFLSLFFLHTTIFNSLLFGIAAGCCCNYFFSFHPAFCLIIGIAIFLIFSFLQSTAVGFWIIGVILSVAWGFVIAVFVYMFTHDMIWFYVSWLLGFAVMLMAYIHSRDEILD